MTTCCRRAVALSGRKLSCWITSPAYRLHLFQSDFQWTQSWKIDAFSNKGDSLKMSDCTYIILYSEAHDQAVFTFTAQSVNFFWLEEAEPSNITRRMTMQEHEHWLYSRGVSCEAVWLYNNFFVAKRLKHFITTLLVKAQYLLFIWEQASLNKIHWN